MRALALLLLWALSAGAELWGAAWREYELTSDVELGELTPRAHTVGWRVVGTLRVRRVVQHHTDQHHDNVTLHLQLESPQLQLRGTARGADWVPRPSLWDSAPRYSAAAALHAGRLAVYLDPEHPPSVQDFMRGLVALMHFQTEEGERNETDISGECSVLYERLDEHDVRKIKRGCRRAGDAGDGGVTSRRVTRYSLRDGAVHALHAEEVHALRALSGAGVKTRAVTRLAARPNTAADIDLPLPPALQLADLEQPHRSDETDLEEEEQWREVAVDSHEALQLCARLGADAAGELPEPGALLRLLPAALAANRTALAALLARADHDEPALLGAARLLGAAGTGAAWAAAAAHLQLRDGVGARAEELGAAFLGALSLSAAPAPAAVRAALSLGAASARTRSFALLGAAAAASRVKHAPTLASTVRDDLAKQLARCKDEECRSLLVLALGNLRRADTAELLLEQAERGEAASTAAVRALHALPPHALPAARRVRLLRLAERGDRPLELRAAALDLAVRRSAAAPLLLVPTARALHAEPGAAELRRVLWQRLRELADGGSDPVRDLLRAAHSDPQLGTWHARAIPGTSSVFTREAAAGADGTQLTLDAHSLADAGLLRRAVVAAGTGGGAPALEVELWTRGLAAVAGGGGAEREGEEPAAGVQLAVRGVALPPLQLFTGQAELLGHVWAGTGSSDTPVLRAALQLQAGGARVPLLLGGEVELSARVAAAAAVDARASVSLWARTAAARLQARAAVAGRVRARAGAGWGAARAAAADDLAGQLHVDADLDFYSDVALCVRAHVDGRSDLRSWRLHSALGGRRWAVRRGGERRAAVGGRTLRLGAHNDRHCRALAPATD